MASSEDDADCMMATEPFEIVRLIVEVAALGGVLFTIVKSIAKTANRLSVRLDHLDLCVDNLKDRMIDRETEDRGLRDELMYLKGASGIPKDKPVTNMRTDVVS